MSLARKAVRGAAFTIGSSIGGRLVGVIGTLVLTRFLAPEVVGEVGVASVLVLTANQLSGFGLGQYVVAKPESGRRAAFHATIYYVGFGAVALGALLLLRHPLAPVFDAPDMAAFVPGLVGASMIDRLGFVPQRVLFRDMRFGLVAVTRSGSELAYTGVSVGLAAYGWGGEAIVLGNVARSLLRSAVFIAVVDRRDWLELSRLDRETSRHMFSFGIPIAIASSCALASRKWDNLLFSALFGPATMGLYNLAYNLADIPASQVGEHIGDVLLPSFAHLSPEARRRALVRSTSLLALLVFPLAVGLAVIAHPLVATLFNEQWQGVAPFLVILAVLSVVRPVGWTIMSYMQARDLPRQIMALEIGKVVLLVGCVVGLATLGPMWACAGVGLAFGLHAVASMFVIRHHDGIPVSEPLRGMAGPLAACGVMAVAVLLVQIGFRHVGIPRLAEVGAGIVLGALVYVGAAFALASVTARDCLSLIRRSFFGGRAATGTD